MAHLDDIRVLLWAFGSTSPDPLLPTLLVRLALGWGLSALRSAGTSRSRHRQGEDR